MSGKKSRDKGARGEREWARVCTDAGYPSHRGRQYHGGADSPDTVGLPGIHTEVKRVEKLNLYNAMVQSIVEKKAGELPIVAHRRNDCEWLVTMRAKDWFELFREWDAGRLPFTGKDGEEGQ